MTSQKYIFDPLSTIIKLAILANKEIGSKIVINNNSIDVQEYSLIQGIKRLYLGQNKNDIHYLSIPIELACKIYLTKETISIIPKIMLIFKCSQNGLLKLIETYKQHPVIVHCLKYYHSIIDLYINKLEDDKKEEQKEKEDKEKKSIIKPILIPIENDLFIPDVSQSLPNQLIGNHKKKKKNIIQLISDNDNTLNTINILNNNEKLNTENDNKQNNESSNESSNEPSNKYSNESFNEPSNESFNESSNEPSNEPSEQNNDI